MAEHAVPVYEMDTMTAKQLATLNVGELRIRMAVQLTTLTIGFWHHVFNLTAMLL